MTSGVFEGTETIRYLGYEIEVGATDVTITSPDGEELIANARIELSGARKFVRKHRLYVRHRHTNQEV